MRPLSPRQQDVYDFICREIIDTGLAPTRKEIARALEIKSPSAIDTHLKALDFKGWIDLLPDTQRGIRLIGRGDVPLLYADASNPMDRPLDVRKDAIGRIPGAIVSRFELSPTFFLELVVRNSITIGNQRKGEILAVNSRVTPERGGIVLARENGWFRVGWFSKTDERFADFEPFFSYPKSTTKIDLNGGDFYIEGVVTGHLSTSVAFHRHWVHREIP